MKYQFKIIFAKIILLKMELVQIQMAQNQLSKIAFSNITALLLLVELYFLGTIIISLQQRIASLVIIMLFLEGIFILKVKSNQIIIYFKQLFQINIAFLQGKNIYSSPILLRFQYGQIENMCTIKRSQNDSFIVDQVILLKKSKIFGFETDYILFPNGQKIHQYKLFDWKNRKSLYPNLNFRILAISSNEEKYINLQNSFCNIRSGLTQQNQATSIQYTNNYTSLNIVYFNQQTEDYNLDDLVINFPLEFEVNVSVIMLLEFQCSSISILIFNTNYPYNYIQHQNYSIRFFLKPFPCQQGEIKNIDNGACKTCDSEQGFFNLKINENSCLIKDDISTIQVYTAQLQLRPGFWRPYFDTSIISNCHNLPQNCLGGWVEGDTSCLLGHIGALCEQCDIQNKRGDGKFFETNLYNCQSCRNQINQIILISMLTIYISISISISATSNIESVKSQLILIKMKILGLRAIFQYNQKAILLKIATNYLQIVGLISNFQSIFNNERLSSILNISANPTENLTKSFDCLLSQEFNMSIHYIRILLLLLQPLLFITLMFLIYFSSQLFKKKSLNILLFSTTMIYVYIYFQPNLVGKLVQLLSYRKISNYKWILANIAFRYDEEQHFYWMIYFLMPMLFFIAFMTPLFFFYGLHSNQNMLNQKSVRLKWSYLYFEYKEEVYKWEILRISKKIILLGLLNYYQSFPITQIIIIILTLLLYLQFTKQFKPYYPKNLNKLDYQSMNTCLISIIFGVIKSKQLGILGQNYFQEIVFSAIKIRFTQRILMQLFYQYLQESSINFKMKPDQIRESIRKIFPFLQKFKSIWCQLQSQSIKEQRSLKLFNVLKKYLMKQAKHRLEKKRSTAVIDCKLNKNYMHVQKIGYNL